MSSSNVGSTDTTKMNLDHDITVNGRTYKAGRNVEVPKKQAEDIDRMNYEHNQYKENLMKKRTMQVDGGTISAGGGAQ